MSDRESRDRLAALERRLQRIEDERAIERMIAEQQDIAAERRARAFNLGDIDALAATAGGDEA